VRRQNFGAKTGRQLSDQIAFLLVNSASGREFFTDKLAVEEDKICGKVAKWESTGILFERTSTFSNFAQAEDNKDLSSRT
jgi:hypothetical protein